jgi:hypothetical protein
MARRFTAAITLLLALTLACDAGRVRSIVFYNFALLDESAPDEHYEHFVQLGGGIVPLGCLVVQRRQINCVDNAGTGMPNLRLAVVECTCPCAVVEPDPCDASRAPVRSGTIRGLVDQADGPIVLGGVELPMEIALDQATELFLTREPNTDGDPTPSADVLLDGVLQRDGRVLRGQLESPGVDPVQGNVTIMPVEDEVQL